MRAAKLKHLRSANSEDAVTWNAFRSLRQVDPALWLPRLFVSGFSALPSPSPAHATVELWATLPPPLRLLLSGDEGESEVDVLIESPEWVWVIEAKFGSDISTGTTTRPTRDQVLRNIDVGSYYAGVRPFYFSLLIASDERSPRGVQALGSYMSADALRALSADHRPDGLRNLQGVSLLYWHQVASVLGEVAATTTRPDERRYAVAASEWLAAKGLTDVRPL
jgi:hypothetical protein